MTTDNAQPPSTSAAADGTAAMAASAADRYRETTKWLAGLLPIAAAVTAGTSTVPALISHEGPQVIWAWLLLAVALLLAGAIVVVAQRVLVTSDVGWIQARDELSDEVTSAGNNPVPAGTLAREIADDQGLLDEIGVPDIVGLRAVAMATADSRNTRSFRRAITAVTTRREVARRFKRFSVWALLGGSGLMVALVWATALAGSASPIVVEAKLDAFTEVRLFPTGEDPTTEGPLLEPCIGVDVTQGVNAVVLAGGTHRADVLLDQPGCETMVIHWEREHGYMAPR